MNPATLDAVPPPPRTPSPRARALIFAYQGTQQALLLVGAIFAVAGSVFAVVFGWGLPCDLAIALSPHKQRGRVISAQVDRSVTINHAHPTVIRFTYLHEGARIEAQSSTLDQRIAKEAQGEDAVLPIEVASVHPTWARVEGTTRATFGYGGAIALLFPFAGCALLLLGVRSHLRRVRAFTLGVPATGKVVFSGLDRSTKLNGKSPYQVRWEFSAADGEIHRGSIDSMDETQLDQHRRDEEVIVLYDPEDPSINTLYLE